VDHGGEHEARLWRGREKNEQNEDDWICRSGGYHVHSENKTKDTIPQTVEQSYCTGVPGPNVKIVFLKLLGRVERVDNSPTLRGRITSARRTWIFDTGCRTKIKTGREFKS